MAGKKVIFKDQFVQIEWTNRLPDLLKSASTRQLQIELDAVIKAEVLPLIGKGLSPVKGQRTFTKYKDPKKYPGDFNKGNKQSNKPNLYLTGEMLSNYKAKAYNQGGLSGSMGIHRDASQRSKLLAGVHNNGENKNVPMRPFIPKQDQGESYTAKITSSIRKAFKYVLGRALNNNKGRGQK
jgi:hypothetical protein